MADEAHDLGIAIDMEALGRTLGFPVVETVAVEGRGLPELREALTRGRAVPPRSSRGRRGHRRVGRRPGRRGSAAPARRPRPVAGAPGAAPSREPLTGLPILVAVLYLVYLFVGVFGAQTLVGCLEDGLFGDVHQPRRHRLAEPVHSVGLARDFLVGIRAHHDGPDLRDRHRPAGRGDVLPDLRIPRGQRLHSAGRHLHRPASSGRWG